MARQMTLFGSVSNPANLFMLIDGLSYRYWGDVDAGKRNPWRNIIEDMDEQIEYGEITEADKAKVIKAIEEQGKGEAGFVPYKGKKRSNPRKPKSAAEATDQYELGYWSGAIEGGVRDTDGAPADYKRGYKDGAAAVKGDPGLLREAQGYFAASRDPAKIGSMLIDAEGAKIIANPAGGNMKWTKRGSTYRSGGGRFSIRKVSGGWLLYHPAVKRLRRPEGAIGVYATLKAAKAEADSRAAWRAQFGLTRNPGPGPAAPTAAALMVGQVPFRETAHIGGFAVRNLGAGYYSVNAERMTTAQAQRAVSKRGNPTLEYSTRNPSRSSNMSSKLKWTRPNPNEWIAQGAAGDDVEYVIQKTGKLYEMVAGVYDSGGTLTHEVAYTRHRKLATAKQSAQALSSALASFAGVSRVDLGAGFRRARPAAEIEQAAANMDGWCTTCHDFTGGPVEPDARGYHCESCGKNTLMGVEDAVITGKLLFAEDMRLV